MPIKLKTKKAGVVILFAVLMVSVILTISLGIFNITYRQLVLSSIARESEIAFFAADTARNCALYWDGPGRLANERPFGVYTPDPEGGWLFSLTGTNAISCAGVNNISVSNYNAGSGYSGRTFKLFIRMGDRDACAQVFVKKDYGYSGNRHTEIRANGYNISTGGVCPPTNVNRAVERTLVAETAG